MSYFRRALNLSCPPITSSILAADRRAELDAGAHPDVLQVDRGPELQRGADPGEGGARRPPLRRHLRGELQEPVAPRSGTDLICRSDANTVGFTE